MDRKKLLLATLGHMSCDVNAGALPAALPYIRTACNLDYQATGGLMFAYSCMSSVIQPVLGLIADRHTKPWFIPLGILLAGFGLAFTGFVANYWAIFAALMIGGIGSAFFHPEGARFATRVSGEHKGTGMSLFSIGGNMGFIIGPILITVFAGAFGMRGMAIFGVIALIMAAVIMVMILRMDSAKSKEQKKSGRNASAELEGKNDWPEFLKLACLIVSRSMTFAGCNTFIPLYWVNSFGQSKAVGALALMIFAGFGIASNFLGGFLSDRMGYLRIIRLAYLSLTPILLLLALANNVYMGWLLLPFLGFGLYSPFSSQVVLGQQLLARNIGFASGVTLGLGNTLGGVAQPVLGWVADAFGLNSIFFCLTGFSLMALFFSFLLRGPKAQ